jgi:hypothetical protein
MALERPVVREREAKALDLHHVLVHCPDDLFSVSIPLHEEKQLCGSVVE